MPPTRTPSDSRPLIGVLALQGDVREHVRALTAAGAEACEVRRPSELAEVDGLILPGGESTTMSKLLQVFELMGPLRERVAGGMPTFGSCAGMILLADHIVDGTAGQQVVGGIDMTVRRNAFGRQIDSFEVPVHIDGIDGEPLAAVFIRAPWVESLGPRATALGVVGARPGSDADRSRQSATRIVAVRQGHLLATSFHPELTGDTRMHTYFCDMVKRGQA